MCGATIETPLGVVLPRQMVRREAWPLFPLLPFSNFFVFPLFAFSIVSPFFSPFSLFPCFLFSFSPFFIFPFFLFPRFRFSYQLFIFLHFPFRFFLPLEA